MAGKYILNGHEPVLITDLLKWAQAFEKSDRRVALDTVNGRRVSTVFLGLDHNFSASGPPLLFETMTFDAENGEELCERCATWDEAVAQHKRIVEEVKAHGKV